MATQAQPIGSNRQLFVLNHLIAQTTAQRRVNAPTARELVMKYDEHYEASGALYHQIFKDGDIYKMFYKGDPAIHSYSDAASVYCYAESTDGIHWEKKNLGIVEYNGSKDNNIFLTRKMLFMEDNAFIEDYCATLPESKDVPRENWIEVLTDASKPNLDNFSICMDPRPDCPADERFKALCPLQRRMIDLKDIKVKNSKAVLFAFKSPDGIHWKRLSDQPVIFPGTFDSMNVSFWDETRQQFWAYIRGFHGHHERPLQHVRDVRWCVSKDYRTWTSPVLLDYGEQPDIQLYTSAAQPYPRAPQYFLGFPTRYVDRHQWTSSYDYLPDPEMRRERMEQQEPREGTAITDLTMMASLDGKTWTRFDEALIRPGPYRLGSWVYGDCYPAWPLIELPCCEDPTRAPELNFYIPERTRAIGQAVLRRFSIRQDGFVSLWAGASPCEVVTKPFVFVGDSLNINFSTSAAGWMRFELQDNNGNPIPGFTMEECDEVFGDHTDRPVFWNGNSDVSPLEGKPVQMRIQMSDCDFYSFQFLHT